MQTTSADDEFISERKENSSPASKERSKSEDGKKNHRSSNSPRNAPHTEASSPESGFQFVMIHEPHRPPDTTHRRLVRRHVMEDVHRRRKEKNRFPRTRHNLQSKGSNGLPRVKDVRHENESRPHPSSALSHLEIKDYHSGGSLLFRERSYFDRWTFNNTTPYALLQVNGAPSLIMNSKTWPFPQPLGSGSPNLSIWMAGRIIPAPTGYSGRACLHRHLQVMPYIHGSFEYYTFKGETIRWLNWRLTRHADATSDITIGSILLLLSFEIGRGNSTECVFHITGLQRIVSLRGGLENLSGDTHLVAKVLLIDLLVAMLSNTEPRLQPIRAVQPCRWDHSNILGRFISTSVVSKSPLLGGERLRSLISPCYFEETSIELLQNMQELTAKMLQLEIQPLDTFRLYTVPSQISQPHPSLHKTIQLAASIYMKAFQYPPIQFSSPMNHDEAFRLCYAVEDPTNDQTCAKFPGIYMWILLIAAAATEGSSSETCLVGHGMVVSLITKICLGAGYAWWGDMRRMLINFGKIKNMIAYSKT